MKFITLKTGDKLRADIITAVRIGDAKPATDFCSEQKPRVIVDFYKDLTNHIIINCETLLGRNALAASIMDEINEALSQDLIGIK
jgi:hypothetical protein